LGPCGCVRGVAAMRHSNLSRGRAVMWADSESLRRIRHVSLADMHPPQWTPIEQHATDTPPGLPREIDSELLEGVHDVIGNIAELLHPDLDRYADHSLVMDQFAKYFGF
jgi:hypothetical protein